MTRATPAPGITLKKYSKFGVSIACAKIALSEFRHTWSSDIDLKNLATEYLTAEEMRRFEHFPIKKRQFDWLAGRISVKQAQKHLQESSCRFSSIPIHIAENGRPFIDNRTYVSISHSKDYVLSAVGNAPLGIDTELFTAVRAASISQIIKDAEVAIVMKNRSCTLEQARTLLWSFKEALYKTFGENSFAIFANAVTVIEWKESSPPLWRFEGKNDLHTVDPDDWFVESQLTPTSSHVLVFFLKAHSKYTKQDNSKNQSDELQTDIEYPLSVFP